MKLNGNALSVRRVTIARLIIVFGLIMLCSGANLTSQIKAAHAVSRIGPNLLDKEDAKRGKVQFFQSCALCHGTNADGGEGPNLIRSSIVRHDENGDLIGPVIQDGRPDRGMPAIQLTPEQTSDVVAYIHALISVADNPGNPSPSGDYPLKLLLTGNAEQGKAYFYGKGKCSDCHSPNGDLAHIAKKYKPIDLQARFLYPVGEPLTATVTLAANREYTGQLVHLDAFTVAIRDTDGWYHSWPMAKVKVSVDNPLSAHRALITKYSNADVHNLFAYLESLQ